MSAALAFPPPTGTRWTARRKLQIVIAIRQGRMTIGEVLERYGVSHAELGAWFAGRTFVREQGRARRAGA